MKSICTLIVINLFLALAVPAFSQNLKVDPGVVTLIANDIERLIGDTVDEREWSARVTRDRKQNVINSSCEVKKSRSGLIYICSLNFFIKPYEKFINEGKPWTQTCENLVYEITGIESAPTVRRLRGDDACIETLGESPE